MMFGSGDSEGLGQMGMIPGLPLQLNPATATPKGPMMESGPSSQKKEERFAVPQWSQQETRDFIAIRAELERDFTLAKRNKTLWEAVASRMKDRGYRRSPEQCKCKWKNLVNRYKGKETSDPENGRECPFFDELHAIFTERAKNMHRLLMESESGNVQAKKKMKRLAGERSEDLSEDNEDEDESEEEQQSISRSRKRKTDQEKLGRMLTIDRPRTSGIQEILEDLFQQQQRLEIQWQERMEKRAHERYMLEQEWRQLMEKIERERLLLEQTWREREEQRRIREEKRAEKRDALITTLLKKLIHDDF